MVLPRPGISTQFAKLCGLLVSGAAWASIAGDQLTVARVFLVSDSTIFLEYYYNDNSPCTTIAPTARIQSQDLSLVSKEMVMELRGLLPARRRMEDTLTSRMKALENPNLVRQPEAARLSAEGFEIQSTLRRGDTS